MKGALACYVEAVRAILDAGVPLRRRHHDRGGVRRDREDAVGRGVSRRGVPRLRRRLALPRRRTAAIADMCILGEPTERRSCSATTARCGRDLHERRHSSTPPSPRAAAENSIVRMQDVLGGRARRGSRMGAPRRPTAASTGVVNVGSMRAGAPWRVEPHARPRRPVPRHPRAADEADDAARDALAELFGSCATRHPDAGISSEVYVTAPGAEIDESHPLIARDRRRRTSRSSARRRRATPCAGSRTPRRSRATASRPSTTAPRAAFPTPTARTSRSTACATSRRSTRSSRAEVCGSAA